MRFSIIIPSYNQERFIRKTIENLEILKNCAREEGVELELLLFDSESDELVKRILIEKRSVFDVLKIEKDQGQADAINKGLRILTGDYWTWLNTDDLIEPEGFRKVIRYLRENPSTDYIYGLVKVINESDEVLQIASSGLIGLTKLTQRDASISQPGSFFRTSFTRGIGELGAYRFAFDYEYILRVIKNQGIVKFLPETLAQFRYYVNSKSGSKTPVFLHEEWAISKAYGRKTFSWLTFMLGIRILKRRIFN